VNVSKTKQLIVDFREQERNHQPLWNSRASVVKVDSFRLGPLTSPSGRRKPVSASPRFENPTKEDYMAPHSM